MRIRSVKFNFIMNFILTASAIIFPLITAPYINRVLQAAGNGRVAFAASVLTYFSMFASLGIPTYGIRACAKVRDNKEELSKVVQELLIVNTVTMVITYAIFLVLLFVVPKFAAEKTLLMINSITLVLNVFGVSWLYNALEQYAYITACSMIFKVISIIMMFAWVHNPDDYVVYGAITVFAASGSYILNFINMHKFVSLKKRWKYDFKRHVKPIIIFFSMSAATSVYTNLDVVMLGFMKTNAEVGYYNAAIKVKVILVSFITSLGTVLLPRLSYYIENKEQEMFRKTIVKAFNFVLIMGTSVSLYFMIFSEESILILAGKGFGPAVLPMMLLMPTVFLIGMSNITGIQILTPLGREKEVLYSIVCGAVLDFILNFVLIPKYGAAGASFATLAAEVVVLVVQVVFLKEIIGGVVREISIRKTLIALVPACVTVVLFKNNIALAPFLMMCVTVVIFYGIYGVMLLMQKEKFTMEMVGMVIGIVKRK